MNPSKQKLVALFAISSAILSACKTTSSYTNQSSQLKMDLVARYTSGQFGEGAAEVLAYDKQQKSLYVVNGAAKAVDIIPLSNMPTTKLSLPYSGSNLASQRLELPASVSTTTQQNIALGSPNSLAIHGNTLAIAVENKNKQKQGVVLFYSLSDEQLEFSKAVSVGALPDMLTFSHDGSKVLVANEGEPSNDYKQDPEGSISIIMTAPRIANEAITLGFTAYNSQRDSLMASGVKFACPETTTVAQDLEPEYISISPDDATAFVSLQENNAIAVVDLKSFSIKSVKGLGYKDWNQYSIDVSNKDGINLSRYENLYGLYQPDSLASYQVNGKTYILSANEGDAREYIYEATEAECQAAGHQYDDEDGCISYSEEFRAKKLSIKSPSIIDSYYQKDGIGRLKVTNVLGDEDGDGMYEKLYSFGARSFSIWSPDAELVYDSGDEFDRILLELDGDNFNNNESENKGDNRSDDKGSEPEAITIGQINGRSYAFIGLERQGGIMAYDISVPHAPKFSGYTINRNFDLEFEIDDDTSPVTLSGDYTKVGDLAPEGLAFIDAENSPNGQPLLAVANEVSGSVSIYQLSAP